ncbi:hypothetical protein [Loigolactobacillus iwatensis]|uniref:hypothetical protein n=1 Tax=Loigolactobacillus iwatensis TaxID=1267156 RepID=UPI000F7F09BB|nr:hypothetical protein [Loigolactobacillus iwatensis]
MTDYKTQLTELEAGKRKLIEVSKDDFYAFRTAWLDYPRRKSIVGEAHRGGNITYHYDRTAGQK